MVGRSVHCDSGNGFRTRKRADAIEAFLGARAAEGCRKLRRRNILSLILMNIPRAKAKEIPAAERIQSIHVEDVAGLSDSEIRKEACRCVSCGCLAVGPSDLAIALVALDASIVTTKRTLPAQAFLHCNRIELYRS